MKEAQQGVKPLKITDVKTYLVGNPWKNWLFAVVETDEGITGIGEGTLNAFGRTVEAAVQELKPLVIGLSPFQTEVIGLRLLRDVYSDGGQIQGAALSAIEFACWDIIGKATRQPLYQLLGGRCHDRLRAYANGWYQGERTPESFHARAKEVVQRGYTALKFDPFGSAWLHTDKQDFGLAVEIIAAVRDAVGPDVDILIEGHNRFSVHTAIRFAEAMAKYRPAWFEAPTPPWRIRSVVEVARHSPVPVACGEDYYRIEQFDELLSYDAVHIIQLEPQYLGLTTSKKVTGMVQATNGVTAPHSAQGPVCSLVCSHLNLATPNFYIHEIFDDFNVPWLREILSYTVQVKDGYIQVPDTPGIGADLVLEEIRKHPYEPGNYLPLFRPGWEKREGARER